MTWAQALEIFLATAAMAICLVPLSCLVTWTQAPQICLTIGLDMSALEMEMAIGMTMIGTLEIGHPHKTLSNPLIHPLAVDGAIPARQMEEIGEIGFHPQGCCLVEQAQEVRGMGPLLV